MFNEYIEKAMQHAYYEQLEEGTYFGRIPGFKGVWANQPTQQECREELREVLEGWILLNMADHTPLPTVDGMTLYEMRGTRSHTLTHCRSLSTASLYW